METNGLNKVDLYGKESILSNLYTLRAGLSVISQKKDKVDNILTNANNNKNNIMKKAQKTYSEAVAKRNEIKQQLDRTKQLATQSKNSIHPLVGDIIWNNILRRIFTILFYIVILSLTLIPIIFAVIIDLNYNNVISLFDASSTSTGALVGENIVLIIASAGLIGLFFFLRYKALDEWDWDFWGRGIDTIDKKRSDKSRAKRTLSECQKSIAVLQNKLNQVETLFKSEKANLELETNRANEIVKSAYERAMTHVQAAVVLIKSLDNAFGFMIDKRDWANIDFIIYYFETGRADSMKEALAIVDSEKRANRFAVAIKQASNEINRTLNRGFSNMTSMLANGFDRLSDIMVTQTRIMANEMQATREAINLQSDLTSQLISQTNLQSALLAKANESSAELVRKADTMNGYAHKLVYGT